MTNHYSPNFYATIRPGVRSSAEALVPVMGEWCIQHTGVLPVSVVDVGCGEGWWAWEWVISEAADCADGIDGQWPGAGDAITQADGLPDPRGERAVLDFVPMDLDNVNEQWSADPRYDVAICLEVAEHLRNPDALLGWLRKLAPVVFFSAAVPGQPGAGHINCRWQADWAENFKDAGWWTHDIRPSIWGDGRIEWWYRQNLFVAWDPTVDHRYAPVVPKDEPVMSVVHPEMWQVRHDCR